MAPIESMTTASTPNMYRNQQNGIEKSSIGNKSDSSLEIKSLRLDPVDKKPFRKSLTDYFRREPCLYSANVLKCAGRVFQALRHDTPDDNPYTKHYKKKEQPKPVAIPHIDFVNDKDKRRTFELAFATLKYQSVLENLLDDVAFFSMFPELKEEEGVVMVAFYDFQKRKYQRRTPPLGEESDEIIESVEDALNELKTKLSAALARCRIKANARSIDYLLPETVRKSENTSRAVPLAAWVNEFKTSLSDVIDTLKDEGYKMVTSSKHLKDEEFCIDEYCSNVLFFHADKLEHLKLHNLVQDGHLVIQDWTSCLGPHTCKHLVSPGADVVHVNIGAGFTTAHIGCLLASTDSMVLGFGMKDQSQEEDLQNRLDDLGAKNVKLISEQFLDIDPDDVKYRGIRVVLITAECSKTGIANPIDFIVNEGEDMSILKDLSAGEYDLSKIGELIGKHSALLRHALKFPRITSVVYVTRSVQESENEGCVMKAVESINSAQHNLKKVTPFRLRPPVLPLVNTSMENGYISNMNGYNTAEPPSPSRQQQKWLKFEPSNTNNGCFVAIISREGEEVKESAKDVLARAQARGLLSGAKGKREKITKSETDANLSPTNTNGVERPKTAKPAPRRRTKSPSKRVQSSPQRVTSSPASNGKKSKSTVNSEPRAKLSVPTKMFPQVLTDATSFSRTDKPKVVSEYQKVIKHPMPFSNEQ